MKNNLALVFVATLANATPVLLSITQSTQAPAGLQDSSIGSFNELAPTPTSFVINTDFKFLIASQYGPAGLGSGTGFAHSLIGVGSQGCAASDFTDFQAGSFLVTVDSTCFFSTIVNNAAAAGAVGVAIGGSDDVFSTTFGLADPTFIPALIATTDIINGIVAKLATPTSVPEPASFVLMLLALIAFGSFARRGSTTRS
jgi:hypothetical protein